MPRSDPGHQKTLFAHKISWTVDESRKLEFMLMTVFFSGEIFKEMHMLSVSDFNGTAGFSIKFNTRVLPVIS